MIHIRNKKKPIDITIEEMRYFKFYYDTHKHTHKLTLTRTCKNTQHTHTFTYNTTHTKIGKELH